VLQPVVEMVAAATSSLLDMLAGEVVYPEPRIFVPRLVEGESA
jgi:DNA-binding LacI/PurR family transcriptional regulator